MISDNPIENISHDSEQHQATWEMHEKQLFIWVNDFKEFTEQLIMINDEIAHIRQGIRFCKCTRIIGLISSFNSIWNFVGYLMSKPSL